MTASDLDVKKDVFGQLVRVELTDGRLYVGNEQFIYSLCRPT